MKTKPITPFVGHPGWNLVTAMADEAIGWMKQLNDIDQWVRGTRFCPSTPSTRVLPRT
jgi:hypothetical protein